MKKLINWQTVCLPLNHGGLLAKWLWRCLTPGQFIWKDWILHRLYQANPFFILHFSPSFNPSPFWKGVLSTIPRLKSLFHVIVNNGNSCLFGMDIWNEQILFSSLFPNFALLNQFNPLSVTSAHSLGPLSLLPSTYFGLETINELVCIDHILNTTQFNPDPDRFIWALGPTSL